MESELSYIVILVVCFILSALFAAAETALTSVPETYIRKLQEDKRYFYRALSLWLKKPNSMLTAIIVGNNLVNTLAAVNATLLAQLLLKEFVISIVTGATTLSLLIFGEITPKTFARHNAKKSVGLLAFIIYPFYFIFFPAVWILSQFATRFVKAVGGHIEREGPVATEEDITHLIKLGHEEGVFKKDHGQMLQSVIAFRDTTVREVMVPRTELCSLDMNISYDDMIKEVLKAGYTRWPVYSGDIDNVKGILYVKDLIKFDLKQNEKSFSLKNLLRPAIFIPESMQLDTALREFQKQKIHLAIVIDEYGGTAGIVSLEDILEEIVGEIRDEYDREEDEETIVKLSDNHFLIDGLCSISELAKKTGIILPGDETYETLGGFLTSKSQRFPKKGEVITYQNYVFTISEVDQKRVIKSKARIFKEIMDGQ